MVLIILTSEVFVVDTKSFYVIVSPYFFLRSLGSEVAVEFGGQEEREGA